MSFLSRLDQFYKHAKSNKWYRGFAIFCRIALAVAFIISATVKIRGERFAAGLSVNNPLGHYFEALYHTGYYYTFIGVGQVLIAVLLLIPRTAALGALMYFPVILNICILTYATRFEGTRATTFMLLASVFLLGWYYDHLKFLLPFKQVSEDDRLPDKKPLNSKFPFIFFGSVIAMITVVIVINIYLYNIRPGNSVEECTNGCPGNSNPKACYEFCDCIYGQGKPLRECLGNYENAKALAK